MILRNRIVMAPLGTNLADVNGGGDPGAHRLVMWSGPGEGSA